MSSKTISADTVSISGATTFSSTVSGFTAGTAVAMGGYKITNLGTPETDAEAATKGYVDGVLEGHDPKGSVVTVATSDVGGVYANGDDAGVGATITASANSSFNDDIGAVNGVTLDTVGQRVLLAAQDGGADLENGIYKLSVVGDGSTKWVLTRAEDNDTADQFNHATTLVESGTFSGATFLCTTTEAITVGTTAITWVQNSGLAELVDGTNTTANGNAVDLNATLTGLTSVTASGAVTGGSITDGTATLSSGALAGATGVSSTVASGLTLTASHASSGTINLKSGTNSGAAAIRFHNSGAMGAGFEQFLMTDAGDIEVGSADNVARSLVRKAANAADEDGGNLTIAAGAASSGNAEGGHLILNAGVSQGTGTDGDVELGAANTANVKIGSSMSVTAAGAVTGVTDLTLGAPGSAATIVMPTSSGTGNGLTVTGQQGAVTSAGGNVVVEGGAGGSTSGNGGDVVLRGGSVTSGTTGDISIGATNTVNITVGAATTSTTLNGAVFGTVDSSTFDGTTTSNDADFSTAVAGTIYHRQTGTISSGPQTLTIPTPIAGAHLTVVVNNHTGGSDIDLAANSGTIRGIASSTNTGTARLYSLVAVDSSNWLVISDYGLGASW